MEIMTWIVSEYNEEDFGEKIDTALSAIQGDEGEFIDIKFSTHFYNFKNEVGEVVDQGTKYSAVIIYKTPKS